METTKGMPPIRGNSDIRMNTAKSPLDQNDIYMETARVATTVKQGVVFQPWEKELLESAEVKRKATVAQLCMPLSFAS
jgi:hypothetical protein